MKREWDQERLYLKKGSRFQPLRQGTILAAQLDHTKDKLGSKGSSDFWRFTRNNKYIKKETRTLYYLTLHPHVMKPYRLA